MKVCGKTVPPLSHEPHNFVKKMKWFVTTSIILLQLIVKVFAPLDDCNTMSQTNKIPKILALLYNHLSSGKVL